MLQARKQPTTQAGVIEYLLSTETGEMQYETARCRPQLDTSFFSYLDRQIGTALKICNTCLSPTIMEHDMTQVISIGTALL